MSLRLFMIEARRNTGLWFVPVILLVSWWLLSIWGWIAVLWSSTNQELQTSVVPFAAPAIAGASAWMAGRERRRGTEDLIASTPGSPVKRKITLWAATAVWGIVAYAAFAVYMMGRTAIMATWGGPEIWRVAVVLAAILAFAAWGFFFGTLIPGRFTAPIVAIAALGLQQFFSGYMVPHGDGYSPNWITYLASDKTLIDLAPWQMLIYLGLTGAALTALAVKSKKDVTRWVVLTAFFMATIVGIVMVWVTYTGWEQRIESEIGYREPHPVCEGSPVTVCVHPQFQPFLDETVALVNHLAEPLLGLPGVPLTTEQGDISLRGGGSGSLLEVGNRAWLDASYFADKLVADPESMHHGVIVSEAQIALRSWLLQRAGIESYWNCDDPVSQFSDPADQSTHRACEAAERFEQLTPTEQRAWLEANYADLRLGRTTLEDLP